MRLVILLVCALVSGARADVEQHLATANKLLQTQLTGGLDDDVEQTADYVGVFPGSFGSGSTSSWRFGPPYIGKVTIERSIAGWQGGGEGSWGWIAAELAVWQRPYTPSDGAMAREQRHRYHLLEVFVIAGGTMKVKATLLVDTMDDAKLPAGTPVPGGPPKAGSLLWQLVTPGRIKLVANPNVAVLGSSAGELALGSAAASKLLASWSKLSLSLAATPPRELVAGDLGIGFAEVDLMIGKTPRRMRAMVVAKKIGAAWEVAALGFGADTEFGDPKIP